MNSSANCSIPVLGQCTVPVPYGSNYRALIVTDIPENVVWDENVEVNWYCVNRGWAYAVVILVPILTVVALAVAVVVGTVLYCKIKKDERRSRQIPSWTRSARLTEPHQSSFPRERLEEPQGSYRSAPSFGGEQELTDTSPPTYGAAINFPNPDEPTKHPDVLPPPPPYHAI